MALPVLVLRADPRRPDWFFTDDPACDVMKRVSHLPGTNWARGATWFHRSHLPALEGAWEVRAPSPTDPTSVIVDDGGILRPHQLRGVQFIRSRRGTLLAWTMRLGKSACGVYAHEPKDGPLVVCAPLSARMVWVDWMKRRWPDIEPYLVKGLTYDRTKFLTSPLIFIHYEVLYRHQSIGIQPGTLVLDESHLLANPKSKRTQAVLLYASQAKRVIALTGTPKWNKALGLWAQLAACNPGAWGRWWEFARRYSGPIETDHGVEYAGVSNVAEFRERAAETMSVLTWKDVAKDLPPFTRTVEVIPVSKAERRNLEIAIAEDLDGKNRSAIADQSTFRMRCADLKIDTAVDLARQILDDGEPLILWVHHRAVGRELHKRLPGSVLVTGEVAIDEREQLLRAWQSGTVPNALIISLAVGQVAIDLSRASHEIFVELDWTPGVIEQAEMRPFSPMHPVACTFLCADHPIEREMIEAIVKKSVHAADLGLPTTDTARSLGEVFEVETEHNALSRLTAMFDASTYEEG